MHKKISLQKALLIHLVLSATIPLLLLGLAALWLLNQQLSRSVLEKNSVLAQIAAQQANEVFQDPHQALQQLIALHLDVDETVSLTIGQHLDKTVEAFPFFEAIYLLDKRGHITHLGLPQKLAALRNDYLDLDLSGQSDYQITIEQKKLHWSQPFLSPLTGAYSIALSLPDRSGAVVGVCSLDKLQNLTTAIATPDNLTAAILDRDGGLIFNSDRILAQQHAHFGQIEPVTAAKRGEFGTFAYRLNNQDYLGSTAIIPETGWVLLVSQPKEKAYASLRETSTLFLLGLFITALIAAAVASTIAKRLSRPMARLQQQAEAFTTEGTVVPLPPQPWLEVDTLATSLNQMMATTQQRETELANSRQHYRLLFDNGTDAIFIYRPTIGQVEPFLEVNQAACDWLGLAHAEILKLSISEIDAEITNHPEQLQQMRQTLRQNGQVRFETTLRGAGGRLIPVEINSRLFEFNGEPAVLALARDVTLRRQAQANLLQTHQLLNQIIETSPVAITVLNREAEVEIWNPAAETIFGWRTDEVVGKPLPIFPADLSAEGQQRIRRQLSGEKVPQLDLTRQRKDGRRIQVRAASAPLKNAQGEVTGIISTYSDVSAEKRVEQELRKLAQAVEQSPVSVVITDLNGQIEYVNAAFTDLTGYSLDEALGQNPRLLKSPHTPPSTFVELWNTLKRGETWRGEFCNQRKDGELFWEKAIISPMSDAQGKISHYIAIKENISERRQLEGQLRMAQRMESIGTLTGGIAHDFNNILTAITGYGSLLEIKLEDRPDLQSLARQILAVSNRGASLIRNLLALARREAATVSPFDLNQRFAALHELLAHVLPADIELQIEPFAEPLIINGDETQMDQVLTNLATNARDAMPHGGRLHISCKPTLLDAEFIQMHGFGTPGPYALITFCDNGIGMDEELQRKIFDPFFTTKEFGKGTGLGLAICYGIIKQHLGYITVDSEPGKGTTFYLYFPIIRQATHEKSAATTGSKCSGRGQTILLIEDNEAVRNTLSNLLQEAGYRVVSAGNGPDGLALLQTAQTPVALVLTDMMMPGMNGYELGQQISALHPQLPILYMSGYPNETLNNEGLSDPLLEVIPKPVLPQDLLGRIYSRLNP